MSTAEPPPVQPETVGERKPQRRKKSGICASYEPGRPDSWIARKWAVILVFCLIIWSFYVIVGRICTPAIQQKSWTGFSRATGIGTMIGFVALWLMFVWSYLKIILTKPGFAKEHVAKSERPPPSPIPHSLGYPPSGAVVETGFRDPPELAPVANAVLPAIPPPLSATAPPTRQKGSKDIREVERPLPRIQDGPRWCYHCEIYKPDRTHHCRHCGTCVMVFDHHCLWIGQCVGWANHKFFMIFNFWTSIYCAYVLILQILYLTKSELDGQIIGLLAVAGIFLLFTSMMFASHVHLILTGRSTVESFDGRAQYERESDLLNKEFGFCLRELEKRRVRKHWNELWGHESSDGRWRWGSRMDLWREEMGASWLSWILPIGRPLGDGLHFRSNPHFGPNGEWLQRKDWPKESH